MGVLDYFSEGTDLSPSPVLGPTLEGDLWVSWITLKKPVPRKGRVVFARVVKLVNTGDCHSPGLCSQTYMPYGFEARPRQPKVMPLSYMGWGLSMNFVPGN